MTTWVSKADDARRLIGRLVDEVHRGQISRASELCDPVDIEALPVLMDAARAADAAAARIAELEAVAAEYIAAYDAWEDAATEPPMLSARDRLRTALAAAPTPPAAVPGTGGGWTREAPDGWTLWGERWLVIHGNMTPSKCDVFPRDGVPRVLWGSGEYGIEVVKLWGPRVEPPDGWEAALEQER